MLLSSPSRRKFETGCIGLHLAQARANMSSLGHDSRRQGCAAGIGSCSRPASLFDPAPAPVDVPLLQPAPSQEGPLFGPASETGQSTALAPMIASIAEGLHEELRGFLASFSTRLAAREAALAASCDRAHTAGDFGFSALSRSLDEQLAEALRRSSAERDADFQVIRDNLGNFQRRVDAQSARIDSLIAGEDWGCQLKEATRVFDQKVSTRADAIERRVQELQISDSARHRTWRDALMQRCDGLEQRMSKRFKDHTSLADQVMKVMPDAERMRDLFEQLQTEKAASDTWHRRVVACESAVSRLAGLEAEFVASDKQVTRSIEEQSELSRECLHQQALVGARLCKVESFTQGSDQQLKAMEQRLSTAWDCLQRKSNGTLDNLRESVQQRFVDYDARSHKRVEKMREDFELRVADITMRSQKDARMSTSVVPKAALDAAVMRARPSSNRASSSFPLSQDDIGGSSGHHQSSEFREFSVPQSSSAGHHPSSECLASTPLQGKLGGGGRSGVKDSTGQVDGAMPLSTRSAVSSAIVSPLDGLGHPVYGRGHYEVAEQGLYVKASKARKCKADVIIDSRQQLGSDEGRNTRRQRGSDVIMKQSMSAGALSSAASSESRPRAAESRPRIGVKVDSPEQSRLSASNDAASSESRPRAAESRPRIGVKVGSPEQGRLSASNDISAAASGANSASRPSSPKESSRAEDTKACADDSLQAVAAHFSNVSHPSGFISSPEVPASNLWGAQLQKSVLEPTTSAALGWQNVAHGPASNEIQAGRVESDALVEPAIFPHFDVGALDLEASFVFSENGSHGGEAVGSDHGNLVPETAGSPVDYDVPVLPSVSPAEAAVSRTSLQDAKGLQQGFNRDSPDWADSDGDDDIEAMMLKSMQSGAPRLTENCQPDRQNQTDMVGAETDSDNDIEAMMLKSIQTGAAGAATQLLAEGGTDVEEGGLMQSMQSSLPETRGAPDVSTSQSFEDLLAQRSQKPDQSKSRDMFDILGDDDDDEDDDVEAMMLKSMQPGKADLPRSSLDASTSHAGEAAVAQVSVETAGPSVDDDEDDIEAMMLQSMQSGGPRSRSTRDAR